MRLTLITCLLLMMLVIPAQAQDDLQTLTSTDGTFSLQVPASWIAIESDNVYIIGTTQGAIENITGEGTAAPGDILMLAIGPGAMAQEVEIQEGAPLVEVAQGVQDVITADIPASFGEIEEFPLPDGRLAAGAEVTEASALGGAFLVFDEGDGSYLGIIVLGDPETLEESEEQVGNIAFSLKSGGEEDVALGTASLVWVKAAEDLENISGQMFTVDDRVYISDGISGLKIFSLEGELQGVLEVDNPDFTSASDAAPAEDGTLWIADGFSKLIWHVSPEGEVLNSFGGEDVFEGFSPGFIGVGADGNIYADSSPDDGDVILVFSPEGELLWQFTIGDADSFVWSVEMGFDGHLYVNDLASGIQVYDGDGLLVTGSFARGTTAFQFVSSFKPLADGNFILSTSGEGDEGYTVNYLDVDGERIARFTSDDLGLEAAYSITDFALLPDGTILVGDMNFDGAQIYAIEIVLAE